MSAFGETSPTVSSVFVFDVAPGDGGKTCTLVFLLPGDASSLNLTGTGQVEFSRLDLDGGRGRDHAIGRQTTHNNLPDTALSYTRLAVAPDNAYVVESFACPADGRGVAVELGSVPGAGGTELRFRQSIEPCPLGLFIVASGDEGTEL
ncbi:ubiquitin 3 binding protein But2 [Durotheca rogersii]|uniref:ubiquitin 3 binding protein But2 n=1 Tax=Durotheca rogersii TaxID=419775 RepID=UPI00221F7513|nr:ubiquitin 3 binding protein But2 [Durotheca rogersii]KAI5859963.1 ubiquitin 3 binding protein But2 [Durotheca rogersii]